MSVPWPLTIVDNSTWPIAVASTQYIWTKHDKAPEYEIVEYLDDHGKMVKYDPDYCLDLGSQPPRTNCPGWIYRYHLAIEKEHVERCKIREDEIKLRDVMVANFQRMEDERQANIAVRKKLNLDYTEFEKPILSKEYIKTVKKIEAERKRREAKIKFEDLTFYRKRKRDENVDIYVDYWLRPKKRIRRKIPVKRERIRRPPTPVNPCPFRC